MKQDVSNITEEQLAALFPIIPERTQSELERGFYSRKTVSSIGLRG